MSSIQLYEVYAAPQKWNSGVFATVLFPKNDAIVMKYTSKE